jgi:hypothetical protein
MKKIVALVLTLSVILISCGKDSLLLPQGEIPAWLKTRIAEDEAKIESDATSGLDLGAWMRYKYEGEYYFEYYNPIMSSLPPVFDYDGTQINYFEPPYLDFQEKKCCKKYVWKGPSYFGE